MRDWASADVVQKEYIHRFCQPRAYYPNEKVRDGIISQATLCYKSQFKPEFSSEGKKYVAVSSRQ